MELEETTSRFQSEQEMGAELAIARRRTPKEHLDGCPPHEF